MINQFFLDWNMGFACTNFIPLELMSRIDVPKSSFDLLLAPQTNKITIQFQKIQVRCATFIQGEYRLDFYLLPLGRLVLIQEAPGQLLNIFWTASGQLLDTFWTTPGHLLDNFWTTSGQHLGNYGHCQFNMINQFPLDCNMGFACTNFIALELMSRIDAPRSSFDLLLSPQTNRITIQFQKIHVRCATFIQGEYRLDFYVLPWVV